MARLNRTSVSDRTRFFFDILHSPSDWSVVNGWARHTLGRNFIFASEALRRVVEAAIRRGISGLTAKCVIENGERGGVGLPRQFCPDHNVSERGTGITPTNRHNRKSLGRLF